MTKQEKEFVNAMGQKYLTLSEVVLSLNKDLTRLYIIQLINCITIALLAFIR